MGTDATKDPGVKAIDEADTDAAKIEAESELIEQTATPHDPDLEQPSQSKEPWRGDA